MFFQPKDIHSISQQLKDGAVGVFPCDTILGLVALANEENQKRLSQIKKRSPEKPFLLLLPNQECLSEVVADITPLQQHYMDEYWPGPLTLIFNKSPNLFSQLTGGLDTIACRIPSFLPLNMLLNHVNQPLFSTSVNESETAYATSAETIPETLSSAVDFIYAPFINNVQKESKIIDARGETAVILRH